MDSHFLSFLESLPVAVVAVDRQGNVVLWNATAERYLGWRKEEVIGRPLPFVPPDLQSEYQRLREGIFGGQALPHLVTRRLHKSGRVLDVVLSAAGLRGPSGEITAGIAVIQDTSDVADAQRRMHTAESRYDFLLEQIPAIVMTWDMNLRVTAAHGAGLSTLGWDGRDMLGTTLEGLGVERDTPPYKAITAALAGRSSRWEWSFARRAYDNHVEPTRDASGAITGAITLTVDITEQRAAQSEILRSREDLRRLSTGMRRMQEEERRAIAREVHDELGQRLTALRLDLGLLRNEIQHQQEAAINDRLALMFGLIDETIGTVRRVATQLRPAILDDFGFRAAVETELNALRTRTGMRTTLHFLPEDLEVSGSSATALYRIVQEALTNVAKHSGATNIEVRIRRSGALIEAEISDNGRGVSAEDRASSSTLGLLGIRERALALGGSAEFESAVGSGMRVKVTIPYENPDRG